MSTDGSRVIATGSSPVGDHRRLHDLLTELRHQAGAPSLRKINNACGVSVGHLSEIFAGKAAPGPEVAVRIAQALRAGERDQARVRFLAEGVGADRSARRATDPGRERKPGWEGCPYRGLPPFEERHARIFYGRRALTERLLGRLRDHPYAAGLLLILGPSGAGKSSLLRAGLMGSLADGRLAPGTECWPRRVLTPTAEPVRHLAVQLAELAGADPISVQKALVANPGQAHLLAAQVLAAAGQPGRLVLVVDQLEELFTLTTDPGEQERFLTALHSMATTPVLADGAPAALVVAGIRGDFLDQALAFEVVRQATEAGAFTVGAMSEAELREAIVGPAAEAGVRVPDDVCTAVLDDLRERGLPVGFDSGALPLLSQVMFVMWQAGAGFTVAGYHRTGGVSDIVRTSAETVYQGLDADRQDLARRLFVHLTTVTDGKLTRRAGTRAALRAAVGSAESDALVEAFAGQRLLTVADNDLVTVAHEELLRSWGRLRDWLQPSLTDQALHRALTDDVQNWQQRRRDPSYLYQGGRLVAVADAVRRWTDDPGRQLSVDPVTVEFLAAGQRRARRRRRAYQAVAAAMVVLLVLAGGAALLARRKSADAERQSVLALSRQLAALSRTASAADRTAAEQFAAAALGAAETDEALAAAAALLADPRSVLPGQVHTLSFSPDGKLLATGGDGMARLWDPRTGQPVGPPLTGHRGAVWHMTFSPDGSRLAVGSEGGTVRLWDPRTGQPIGPPAPGHAAAVLRMMFSHDGRLLITAGEDGKVRFWDSGTGQPSGEPLTGSAPVAISPDGTLLATGGKTARLWNLTTRQPVSAPLDGATVMAFGPGGKVLATGDKDGTVRLRDPATGQPIGEPLTGHTENIYLMTFSPDGSLLATGDEYGAVRLWDSSTGRPVGKPLSGGFELVFSPDGKLLATGGIGMRLWDTRTGRPVGKPLTADGVDMWAVAFSPDGRQLVAAGADQQTRLWNTDTGRPVGAPLAGTGTVAVSSDGTLVATHSGDGTARVWDRATGRPVGAPLTGHAGEVWAMTFSPDKTLLAITARTNTIAADRSVETDETVQMWDFKAGRRIGPALAGTSPIAFSPDGSLLTGAPGGTLRRWDPRTGRPVGAPVAVGDAAGMSGLAFSPDGELLATSLDPAVRLWEPRTGQPVRELTGSVNTNTALAFRADGKLVAAGGGDQMVRLWEPQTGRAVATLHPHRGAVHEIAFSPDGNLLVFTEDGTARWWDVRTERMFGAPMVDRIYATGAFSQGGKLLAVAGEDDTVQLWDPALFRDPLAALCHRIAGLSTENLGTYTAQKPDLAACG